jgi:hypothetical protein
VATPLIAYPFQLAPAGSVATAEQDTDEQLAHEIAVAILTSPRERLMATDYGIADPAFAGFEADALRLSNDTHGPPVSIDEVTLRFIDDRTQDVVVYFSTGSEV